MGLVGRSKRKRKLVRREHQDYDAVTTVIIHGFKCSLLFRGPRHGLKYRLSKKGHRCFLLSPFKSRADIPSFVLRYHCQHGCISG